MVFEDEIDRALNPRLMWVRPSGPRLSLTAMKTSLEAKYPAFAVSAFNIPPPDDVAWSASLRPKSGKNGFGVWFSPYTGELLGRDSDRNQFTSQLHQFHLRLLMGNAGRQIVGWAGPFLLLLSLSGLVLWWPRKITSVKWNSTAKRINYDLHHALGIWCSAFLMLFALTAIVIRWEEGASEVANAVTRSPESPPIPRLGPPPAGAQPLDPDRLMAIALAAAPGAQPTFMQLSGNPIRIPLRYPEDRTPAGRTNIYLDAYTGRIVFHMDARSGPLGFRIVKLWNREIHTGDIFGWPTKIAAAFMSLMLPVMAITGPLIWWNRRRRRAPASLNAATFLLLIGSIGLVAQVPRDQQRHEDLQYLVTQLPARHANFYSQTPPSVFLKASQDLDSSIPNLTDDEFYVRLASLAAMGHDAHTSLGWTNAPTFKPLPIQLRWLDDGVFVTAAANDYVYLNGARLLRIGDTAVETALDSLRPVISYENEYWFRAQAPSALRYSGMLRGLHLTAATGPFPFTFLLASGEQRTVNLELASGDLIRPINERPGFVPVTLRRLSEAYWWEYWSDTRALIVAYRLCQEMPSFTISQFGAEIAAALSANPIDSLIFDLRGNPGGNSAFFRTLLTRLQPSLPGLRTNARFRVYGLLDRGVISSGLLGLEDLRAWIPASAQTADGSSLLTFLGEPTGGKPTSYGEVASFQLPHSGIPVQYSTKLFSAPAGIPDRDALYPDLPISLRSTDYFARHDPTMAAVLSRATSLPTAPSGSIFVVNGASYRVESGIAPGSWVSAFGEIPAGATDALINGSKVDLFSSSRGQLVFRLPDTTASGTATIEVLQNGSSTGKGSFTVTPWGPGVFIVNPALNQQPGAILNADGHLNNAGFRVARNGVVQIFATGQGVTGTQPTVWMAQHPAEVLYSGQAPGLPGLWQINARVPDRVDVTGQTPVFISAGGLVSNGVTIWVE